MVRQFLTAALAVASTVAAQAQDRSTGGLPTAVVTEITSIFNDGATIRRSGATDIPRDSVLEGTLAVRTGPLTIAGHIRGSVLAVNADVRFLAGARVDGNVLVVGGRVEGRDQATISGDVRMYAETLRYRMDGDVLLIDEGRPSPLGTIEDDGFWHRGRGDNRTRFDFFTINSANTYNRVEGFPILIGPRLRFDRPWGSALLEARGIVRTAEPIEWNRGSLGHDAKAEIRWGRGTGFGIGVGAFDHIDPVEAWQLTDNEVGLAAAFAHQDYRDYYGRHGGRGFLRGYVGNDASITVSYGEERWEARDTRDPWSLFHDGEGWRPNPVVDEGHARLLTTSLSIDDRDQGYTRGAGWYVRADVEHGQLDPAPFALNPTVTFPTRNYTRGFLDVRRYNRLAPRAELNLRFVTGGWISGDELPLERRLSVSGPGTLPGYDFRTSPMGQEDRLQCSESGGPQVDLPALCDRIALFQVEYRGSLAWHSRDDGSRHWWPSELHTPTWSVFFDSGRGWRARDDGTTTYTITAIPALSTFKSDVGIGLDFGALSVSLAKAITDSGEPMNVVVRLSRRF